MTNAIFQVGYLERLPLGTTYPTIVAHVGRLLAKLPEKTELVIDATGVGKPVFDLFVGNGIAPIGVVITGGNAESQTGNICHVPKLTLISRVQALLHEERLKILRDLTEAETLVSELQSYRVEFTASGTITFNARVGRHDDLVLALAIACWRAHGSGAGQGLFDYYREQAAAVGADTAVADKYVVGVDLGQSRDPTAICVVRKVTSPATVKAPAAPAPVELDPYDFFEGWGQQ